MTGAETLEELAARLGVHTVSVAAYRESWRSVLGNKDLKALRLWLRGARIPEVIEVLELFRGELLTLNVAFEFTTDYRIPEGGPER